MLFRLQRIHVMCDFFKLLKQILLCRLSIGTQDYDVQRKAYDYLRLVPCCHHITTKSYRQQGKIALQ